MRPISRFALLRASAAGVAGSPGGPGGALDFDPYYNDVAWLTKGEGADASTSFTDDSLYGQAVTAYGSVEMDTAIDVEGIPSILSQASFDRLGRAYASEINIFTTAPDFCMECYARSTDLSGDQRLFSRRNGASNNWVWSLNPTEMVFAFFSGTSGTTIFSAAHGLSVDTVHHLCMIRSGGTYYGFVDGVLIGSATPSTPAATFDASDLFFGHSDTNFSDRHFRGNVNHLRFAVGSTRYALSGFTPDPAPFKTTGPDKVTSPTIPNTSAKILHLRAEETVEGAEAMPNMAGTNILAYGVNGARVSTAQAKFGTKSFRIDAGDYLAISDDSAGLLDFHDPSIEGGLSFWVRLDALSGLQTICAKNDTSFEDDINLTVNGSQLELRLYDSATEVLLLRNVGAIGQLTAATWHHIVISKGGGFYYLFLDGELLAKGVPIGLIGSLNFSPLLFGRDGHTGNNTFAGYVDEIIMLDGDMVWDAPFEARTTAASYTAKTAAPNPTFTNVGLLVGFEGADGATTYTDESDHAATCTFTGNAAIDDAQAKFGSTSLLLTATEDYVEVPHNAEISTSQSELTLEVWARPDASHIASGKNSWIFGKRTGSGNEYIFGTGSGIPNFTVWKGGGNVALTPSGITLSADTWYHMVAVKKGNFYHLFLDGNLIAGIWSPGSATTNTTPLAIGRSRFTSGRDASGWFDEARVAAEAFYPLSGFNVPTAAFPRS